MVIALPCLRARRWLALVLFVGFESSATAKKQQEAQCAADGTCHLLDHPQCTVYMAPSTLGEATSMGIFTGIPLKGNTTIRFPEIAIPILFREFGDHVEGYDDGVLWDRYVWEGFVAEIETYEETDISQNRAVFVPGVGCTVNSVLDMANIESTHGSIYDTAGLKRRKDPGSGAFAPYHGSETTTQANISIPAGAELFASYGDYWIPDIPGVQVTLETHLNAADDFLRNEYYPFIQQHEDLTADMKQALWELSSVDFPVYSQAMTNLPRNIPWSEIEEALAKADEETSVVRDVLRQHTVRDVDWLVENGYCQDHLQPGLSKIPQAGRGAFASRALPKGTVVGYAPLVHVGLYGRDIWTVDVQDRKQYDLILNYSFGHRNSTVLLTPYGAGVNYINHGGGKAANVKLRWPDKELIAHKPEYLNRSPVELSNTIDKIGLSFEYVAIRDIKQGEEVLLDYGPEWEAAWKAHVAQWKPVSDEPYVHSSEWEENYIRTTAEQAKNPYPSNLHTMCQESYTYVASKNLYEWVDVLREVPQRAYCKVLQRSSKKEPIKYTVELELEGGVVQVEQVPSEGVFLYDRAFSADWHLPNAFRHEMSIPDDIMPAAWMNGPAKQPDFVIQQKVER